MPVTAAITAGIGAAGAIGSSVIQSNAASKASQQQVAAQQQALQQQQAMFGTAQQTLQPFVSAGQSVLPTLQSLITPGASQTAALAQTPGFQFASQYGTMAARNALTSQGLGASAGPLATAISQYNNGLASATWGNVVNALQSYANMGSGSANTLANDAIGSGNSQASTLGNIGTAQASGTLGSANAVAGGLSGTTNALSNAALLYGLGQNGGSSGLYGGLATGKAFNNANTNSNYYGPLN